MTGDETGRLTYDSVVKVAARPRRGAKTSGRRAAGPGRAGSRADRIRWKPGDQPALAEQEPSNAGWQLDLAMAFFRTAAVDARAGKTDRLLYITEIPSASMQL